MPRFYPDNHDLPLSNALDVCVADGEVVVSSGPYTTVLGVTAALESARRLFAAVRQIAPDAVLKL